MTAGRVRAASTHVEDFDSGLRNALALRRAIDARAGGHRTLEAFALRDPDGLLEPAILEGGHGGRRLGRAVAAGAAAVGAAPYRLSGAVFALTMPAPVPAGTLAGTMRDALAGCSIPLTPTSWVRVAVPEEAQSGGEAIALAVERIRARAAWDPCGPSRQIRDLVLRMAEVRGDRGARTRWSSLTGQALGVGRRLGLDTAELDVLVRAAELRDVGAIALGAVPGSRVLLEAGALARAGADVLSAAPSMAPIARVLRACEERYDGSGAPDGLVGDEIPVQARIIAACLALEHALAGTPFRAGMTADDALADVVRRGGSDFDPGVVEALRALNASAGEPLEAVA